MESSGYIDLLKEKYQKYFDVKNNIYILNEFIDMFAKYNVKNCRTFITKNDIVDSYENNEYCFVKKYKSITKEDVSDFSEFLIRSNQEYVNPHGNHMSTYITGVMISEDTIPEEVKRIAVKFKYSRIHMFYLKGWSETRLILIDMQTEKVVCNKPGKGVKRVYEFTPLNK